MSNETTTSTPTAADVDEQKLAAAAGNHEDYIPDDSDVPIPSNFNPTWRAQAGKLCTGDAADGSYKERTKIVGRLKGIYITEFHPKADSDDKPKQWLEADFLTKDGLITYSTWLSDLAGFFDKPTGLTIGLGWALQNTEFNQLVMITASEGTTLTQYKKYPTFANFFYVNEADLANPKRFPKRPRTDESIEEVWAGMKTKIQGHPAFGERKRKEEAAQVGPSGLDSCTALATARGWHTPEGAPDRWLAMAAGFGNVTPVPITLKDINDTIWKDLYIELEKRTDAQGEPVALRDKATIE